MDNDDNGGTAGDDFGDGFGNDNGGGNGGGGFDWRDPSAAQGTTYWENEGKGTEDMVQGPPDKTGGSSWW